MNGYPADNRLARGLWPLFFLPLSWLWMMGVHELGHVATAAATGGHVQRVVLHPLAISRTDVSPNPRPLIVAWGGPLMGVVLPLTALAIASGLRWRLTPAVQFFAGFAAISNGVYIGAGGIQAIGDAGDLLRYGSPLWLLVGFGGMSTAVGLLLWHRLGMRLGLSNAPIRRADLWVCAVLLLVTVALTVAFCETP